MTGHRHLGIIGLTVAAVVLALGGCGGSGGTSPESSPSATSPTASAEPGVWPEPAGSGLDADVLQSTLEGYVQTYDVSGAAAAVVTPQGVWSGASGVDGLGKEIAADSGFGIASITKTFIAAEILRLSGEGAIDLDAPVTDYVTPPFDAQGATVRQLATMTSGFPAFPSDQVLRPKVSADLEKEWTASDVLALADPSKREGELGGSAVYNGLNYVVLGMVIEKVTGQPLSAALSNDLLAPAGLERIWMQTGVKPQPPLAYPVDDTKDPIVDAESGYLPSLAAASTGVGGAGMGADAPDLARWGYLLYGGRIIDPALVTVMTDSPPSGDANYTFGTMVAPADDGQMMWFHLGDYNQYSSSMIVWPDDRVSVAVLVPTPAQHSWWLALVSDLHEKAVGSP